MMGSQGAPAPVVDELKSLLGLVSDPVKLKAELDRLQAERKLNLDAVLKSQAAMAELSAHKSSFLEKEKDLEGRIAAYRAQAIVVDKKSSEVEERSRLLRSGEEALQNDRQAFDLMLAKSSKDLSDKLKAVDVEIIRLRDEIEKARVSKEEFETKLAKLKAVVG
jgi:predicted  nucleic acid-binding Zn ribbon protein